MNEKPGHDRPLPVDRAFVVQLHVEADLARGRVVGRAVHVVSGRATRFDSLKDLLTFIDRVLRSLHVRPPAEPPGEP
jgi:hypothetical protein